MLLPMFFSGELHVAIPWMDLLKFFLYNRKGVNIIQFLSILFQGLDVRASENLSAS